MEPSEDSVTVYAEMADFRAVRDALAARLRDYGCAVVDSTEPDHFRRTEAITNLKLMEVEELDDVKRFSQPDISDGC